MPTNFLPQLGLPILAILISLGMFLLAKARQTTGDVALTALERTMAQEIQANRAQIQATTAHFADIEAQLAAEAARCAEAIAHLQAECQRCFAEREALERALAQAHRSRGAS